jgi:hypothetical protein
VARNFNNDEKRLAQVDIQFYVLRKDGEYCGASLWGPGPQGRGGAHFAICTSSQASHEEPAVYLLERKA